MNSKMLIWSFLIFCAVYLNVSAQEFDHLESLHVFNVQMHIHGHSHHNASDKPGSIQWHTHQAEEFNVDVLWFSEHDGMLNQNRDFPINFYGAHIDGNGNVSYNRVSNFLPEFLESDSYNGTSKIKIVDDSTIFLQLKHLFGNEAWLRLSPRISKGKLAGFRLPRPISSNAVLNINLHPQFGGTNNTIKILVELSWHITDAPHKQSIAYIISDTLISRSYQLNENGSVEYFLPAKNGQENIYALNLYEDAQKLTFGRDNTITDLQFILHSKDFTTIEANISNISITSLEPEPEHQLKMVDQFSKEYENIYEVKGISGIEYSPYRWNDFSPHFNLFLPNSRLRFKDIVNILPDDKFDYNELIHQVHSMGGVVSFNHVFGTSIYSSGQYSEEIQEFMVDSIATFYMEKNLFDTDILEVGYLSRGGVNLENHLKIWDIFTSNGYFLYGNGTTDAHGGIWRSELPNPFTSWVWAENPMDTSIIEALKSGRFYFGTFQNKVKEFFFNIDEFKMGDRKYTDKSSGVLKIWIDPKPYNYTFRLVQGAVDFPGNEVNYIKKITFDPMNPPSLDLDVSCFIRLEIENVSEGIKIFSNPIILLKRNEYENTIYESRVTQEVNEESSLKLYDPYPNPAKNEVWIPFSLGKEEDLSFSVISPTGEIIHKIFLGKRTQGEYLSKLASIYWNLKIEGDSKLNPGIYFIVADNFENRISKKIIVK
jgi:hypothetical protein